MVLKEANGEFGESHSSKVSVHEGLQEVITERAS